MIINYALQTYDIASNSCFDRYSTNDKKELVHKCISSFFHSVNYASENDDNIHNIVVFDNGSTDETIDLINRAIERFSKKNLSIVLNRINSGSMINSIRICFDWLRMQEGDLIYLVQDDYLFTITAVHEMIDIFVRILNETRHPCLVYPFNTPDHWKVQYRLRPTPRLVHPGYKQYWIQCFDISCTFMTSKEQLIRNWKRVEYFMSIDQINGINGDLENISINKILVDDGVLGLMPFESVALHMQGEREKEPYIDWKGRWNAVDII